MNLFEYTQPEYLFCEIPIKDGGPNDHRVWVYCRMALSLIEFVDVTDVIDHNFDMTYTFDYGVERYLGVFVQNNCSITNKSPDIVMSEAWAFLKSYFEYEDRNLLSGLN